MGVKSKSKSLADRPVPRRTVAEMQGVFTDFTGCDCKKAPCPGRKHSRNSAKFGSWAREKTGLQCAQESYGATASLKHALCGLAISCGRCSLNWGKQFLQIDINVGPKS